MTPCNRIREQIQDLLDGTLSADQSVAVTAHFDTCVDCRREFEALKATQTLLREAPVPDGERSRRRVLTRFRHAVAANPSIQPQVRSRNLPPSLRFAGLAIATACILALFLPKRSEVLPSSVPPASHRTPAALPSEQELTQLNRFHALESVNSLVGGTEMQQNTLADANASLARTEDERE